MGHLSKIGAKPAAFDIPFGRPFGATFFVETGHTFCGGRIHRSEVSLLPKWLMDRIVSGWSEQTIMRLLSHMVQTKIHKKSRREKRTQGTPSWETLVASPVPPL